MAQAREAAKNELFKQWLINNGARFPKIDWPSTDLPGNIRGAKATADIATNENMIEIPIELMMSPPNIFMDEQIGEKLRASMDLIRGDMLLTVFIMHELRKQEASFYYPYLNILPAPGNVTEWNASELELLQDPMMVTRTMQRRAQMKRMYMKCILPLTTRYPTTFPADQFTFECFSFSYNCIQARAFGRRLPWTAMVPFADCLNHGNVQTKYDYDVDNNGLFRLFPSGANSYCSGAEVFNSYGRRTNDNLLTDYGFAMLDNMWEEREVSLALDENDADHDTKSTALFYCGFSAHKMFPLAIDRVPLEALLFLRISTSSALDLTRANAAHDTFQQELVAQRQQQQQQSSVVLTNSSSNGDVNNSDSLPAIDVVDVTMNSTSNFDNARSLYNDAIDNFAAAQSKSAKSASNNNTSTSNTNVTNSCSTNATDHTSGVLRRESLDEADDCFKLKTDEYRPAVNTTTNISSKPSPTTASVNTSPQLSLSFTSLATSANSSSTLQRVMLSNANISASGGSRENDLPTVFSVVRNRKLVHILNASSELKALYTLRSVLHRIDTTTNISSSVTCNNTNNNTSNTSSHVGGCTTTTTIEEDEARLQFLFQHPPAADDDDTGGLDTVQSDADSVTSSDYDTADEFTNTTNRKNNMNNNNTATANDKHWREISALHYRLTRKRIVVNAITMIDTLIAFVEGYVSAAVCEENQGAHADLLMTIRQAEELAQQLLTRLFPHRYLTTNQPHNAANATKNTSNTEKSNNNTDDTDDDFKFYYDRIETYVRNLCNCRQWLLR